MFKAALAIQQKKYATYGHFSTTELVFKYFWRQVYICKGVVAVSVNPDHFTLFKIMPYLFDYNPPFE